ncbi:hypothetical protein HYY75_05375 [bacterium]|nr:hypothetical protein [bacterium]
MAIQRGIGNDLEISWKLSFRVGVAKSWSEFRKTRTKNRATPPARKFGYTLVEISISALIFILVGLMVGRTLTQLRTSTQPGLSDRLILQMDARKSADEITKIIRESGEIVRPFIGETSPYLVLKDVINNVCILYLDNDEETSKICNKKLFKLVFYVGNQSGSFKKEDQRILVRSVKRLTFTSVSPFSVSVNATLANLKGEFQFLTHIGIMNLEDLQ